jgi:phosphohistidine phosphatase
VKQLSILRHAKSGPAAPGQQDIDRTLNDRGRNDARLMADVMREHGLAPDYVFCSPSARTRETFSFLKQALAPDAVTRNPESLYLAAAGAVTAIIRGAPETATHILIIGHNPGLHEFAMRLANAESSDRGALARLAGKFPTAALAHYDVDCENWERLSPRCAALNFFATPKEIAEER